MRKDGQGRPLKYDLSSDFDTNIREEKVAIPGYDTPYLESLNALLAEVHQCLVICFFNFLTICYILQTGGLCVSGDDQGVRAQDLGEPEE